MGEIAELIITGEQCSLCGIEFIESHGYPVVCEHCFNDLTEGEQEDVVLAHKEEF
jgi:hypothetical protein